MNNYCPEAQLENPKCYRVESVDFDSEEQIFDILLDILKSELPPRMQNLKGCDNKPLFIPEDEIDMVPSGKTSRFSMILNPLNDAPTYPESPNLRTVAYNFELVLTVSNPDLKCVTWELIRFKNAVEGLIVGSEIYIDGYNSVVVEPEGFNYYVPQGESSAYFRQGSYRFSVTVTQTRNY